MATQTADVSCQPIKGLERVKKQTGNVNNKNIARRIENKTEKESFEFLIKME